LKGDRSMSIVKILHLEIYSEVPEDLEALKGILKVIDTLREQFRKEGVIYEELVDIDKSGLRIWVEVDKKRGEE